MSKNNDAMVTLMLGETAGGAFGRRLAAIGTGANSEAEATVSALNEVRLELDQAEAEVDSAKAKEEAAADKLKDKQAIAATDGNQPPDQQNANDQDVEKATDDLNEAIRGRQRKQDQRAETRTKSAAKVEQLIAAGSITNKPTAVTAQMLKGMQDNFLQEDFADEMVAACIIELGLSPSEKTLAFRAIQLPTADVFAKIQTNLGVQALDTGEPMDVIESLKFFQSIKSLERTSRLSDYCNTHLSEFVKLARRQEVDLQKLRIGTLAVEAAQHRAIAQSAALKAFEKSVATCNKVTDDKVQAACIAAASRITESDTGLIEVGEAQQIPIVVPNATLPLVAFEAAMEERKSYEKAVSKFEKNSVPTVTKDELKQEKEALDNAGGALTKLITALNMDLDAHLDKLDQTTKKTVVQRFQNQRTQLVTDLALAPISQPLIIELAQLALRQHDIEAKQEEERFSSLDQRMKRAKKGVEEHLESIEALKKKQGDGAG